MTVTAPASPVFASPPLAARQPARVDIVVPVYNEQKVLQDSICRLHAYCSAQLVHDWRIVIADNASTDATACVARRLAATLQRTTVLHLERKGRGRALRAAWSVSDADVLCYMDVDLSTDLRALPPLISALASGHSEVAIGTRLASGSRVVRGRKRELISRSYNRLLRVTLRARFSDAQCGFKAIRADAARRLLPEIADQGWFFDTELLICAQRHGMRIHEVAVDWIDDPDSRLDILSTALGDVRGVIRMSFATALPRFWPSGSSPPSLPTDPWACRRLFGLRDRRLEHHRRRGASPVRGRPATARASASTTGSPSIPRLPARGACRFARQRRRWALFAP